MQLGVPEATALTADVVCEGARNEARANEAVVVRASGPYDVVPGVANVVREVDIEAVYDNGIWLVVVVDPIDGGLPISPPRRHPAWGATSVEFANAEVTNTFTVSVSVFVHFHFCD